MGKQKLYFYSLKYFSVSVCVDKKDLSSWSLFFKKLRNDLILTSVYVDCPT